MGTRLSYSPAEGVGVTSSLTYILPHVHTHNNTHTLAPPPPTHTHTHTHTHMHTLPSILKVFVGIAQFIVVVIASIIIGIVIGMLAALITRFSAHIHGEYAYNDVMGLIYVYK